MKHPYERLPIADVTIMEDQRQPTGAIVLEHSSKINVGTPSKSSWIYWIFIESSNKIKFLESIVRVLVDL